MKPKSLSGALTCTFALVVALLTLVTGAQAAGKYRVLHYFLDKPAMEPQSGLVVDQQGNLYGVATFSATDKCGGGGCGVAFKLTRGSDGKWTYTIIHHFKSSDGDRPSGSLILDSQGNLYGATYFGGAHGAGVVFELSFSGGKWEEQVLYSFGTSGDLQSPVGALTFDGSGNLYGVAQYGGNNQQGGVFELLPSGGRWSEKILYKFTGGSDGGGPTAKLVWDSALNLYSTTAGGGQHGQGVIFELTPSGANWTEAVLYDFTGGSDGGLPGGGVIFDSVGNLYGTTQIGGITSCNAGSGCGTVFELMPALGKWNLSVLHAFDISDGADPYAGLVLDSAGSLYGTTPVGGGFGDGTVFKLSLSGGVWTETLLHSFDFKDGAVPYAGLVFDQQGVLYGAASIGGAGIAYGVIFSITP